MADNQDKAKMEGNAAGQADEETVGADLNNEKTEEAKAEADAPT